MRAPAAHPGLRTIFSFFLGLMLTAFVGIGVYTFHPPPDRLDESLQQLMDEEQVLRGARSEMELGEAERARLGELHEERRRLHEDLRLARRGWNLSTSIVLIVFSTLLLGAALLPSGGAQVLGNGLLLGGLFTMLYGVGWIANSESSLTRFAVMSAALAITVALGWLRFAGRTAQGAGAPPEPGGLAALQARVAALEERLRQAGRLLETGRGEGGW